MIVKCTGCGWEYPQPGRLNCRFCNTILPIQVCKACKVPKQLSNFDTIFDKRNGVHYPRHQCKACEGRRVCANSKAKRLVYKQQIKELFNEWRTMITDLTFVPMTEEEWIKTCRYFGGCAICGESHIEVREFFVAFKDGGRYTVWNMFPMCSTCARPLRAARNPFRWMHKALSGAFRKNLAPGAFDKLYKYLREKVLLYAK